MGRKFTQSSKSIFSHPGSVLQREVPNDHGGWHFVLPGLYLVVLSGLLFWADSRYLLEAHQWGVWPLSGAGLKGILAAPLLHGSLQHWLRNSVTLLVLGAALFYFYPKVAWRVWWLTWLLGGVGVWLIGRPSFHIGASGLIYAWAAFLFFSGALRRQMHLLALSLAVAFFYGGLVWGILPLQTQVSWEAHLSGGAAGLFAALVFRKVPTFRQKRPAPPAKSPEEEAAEIKRLEERWGKNYWLVDDSQAKKSIFVYEFKELPKKEKRE